jgi:hypothetical protein
MIMPCAYLFRDIKKWRRYRIVVIKYPNLAATLPRPTTPIGLKGDADNFIPGTSIRARHIRANKSLSMMRLDRTTYNQCGQQYKSAYGSQPHCIYGQLILQKIHRVRSSPFGIQATGPVNGIVTEIFGYGK